MFLMHYRMYLQRRNVVIKQTSIPLILKKSSVQGIKDTVLLHQSENKYICWWYYIIIPYIYFYYVKDNVDILQKICWRRKQFSGQPQQIYCIWRQPVDNLWKTRSVLNIFFFSVQLCNCIFYYRNYFVVLYKQNIKKHWTVHVASFSGLSNFDCPFGIL